MRPETLLERFSPAWRRETATLSDAARLRRSVLRHLARLLNTRLGSAPAQMDLGTPATVELFHDGLPWQSALNALTRSLETAIRRYEPRLAELRVEHRPGPDPLVLGFHISAVLADGHRTPVTFTTRVTALGQVSIA